MVATIILLAMTVTLFASIFAFVTTFPSPPAQNSNQFQASLVVTPSGTSASAISITHLTGPNVPAGAQIYFKSAGHPSVCPFTAPVSVSLDPNITQLVWKMGQTWNVPFYKICGGSAGSYNDLLPDNITVYVVSNANLLFSVVLPGSQIVTPPQILSTWTSPSPVPKGSALSVDATIAGTFSANSVYVNLANVPGLPTTPVKMVPYQGHWVWNSTGNSSGPTKTGSYTGFINVSGPNGASVYGTVAIPVVSNAGGIIVSISAVPTSGQAPLHVSFAASVSGANGSISYSWQFGDLKGNSSTSATPKDWYNTSGTYLVSLTVTDSNGYQGSATQIVTVTYPFNAGGQASATVGYCPWWYSTCSINVYYQVWNNGSQQISISGHEYMNDTTSSTSLGAWSVSGTVAAHTNTGVVQSAAGVAGPNGDSITVHLILTATVNGQFAGVISSTYTFTVS